MLVPRMFHPKLVCRSALRPVSRFPCSPWMVVTPSTTSASADFCDAVRRPLDPLSPFSETQRRSPRIRYDSFPLTLAAFTWSRFDPFGLHRLLPAHPALHASLRSSYPSSPGFALRLPLHAGSHQRSCLRLAVRRINVRRGLSPPSYRPCRAYTKEGLPF